MFVIVNAHFQSILFPFFPTEGGARMKHIARENSALSLLVIRQPEAYFHISLISSISTTDHQTNDKKPAILILN